MFNCQLAFYIHISFDWFVNYSNFRDYHFSLNRKKGNQIYNIKLLYMIFSDYNFH